MKYLKLFESFEDIDSICKKYGIKNYTINSDGTVDVNGVVNLNDKGLTVLPLKFRRVTGYFNCENNQLTSLEGGPKSVVGDFYCSNNNLTSLEGSPQSVGGDLDCSNNNLTSLEGGPQSIGGDFYCRNNQLTSLEGCPKSVGGDFYCTNNPVFNVWKLISNNNKLDSNIMDLLMDYDAIRDECIIIDRFNDFLKEIGKPPVKSVEGYNNI